MDLGLEKLYTRYSEADMWKQRWLALYQDLYLYVIPNRDALNISFNYSDQGKPTTQAIWDNTAILSAYQRANDLHSLMMPKDRVWGRLVLDPHIFSDAAISQTKPTVDEMNDRIMFYLNQSNLSRVVSSSNLDLVGGTAAIWVESKSDDEPLYFRSIPAVALYIEYSNDDVLNTCWYKCKMIGRKVIELFPKYKGLALEALKESPDETVIVLYGQIKLSHDKFYIYAVLADLDPYCALWEVERDYQQIIIYRDRVRPGESDGRGIGLDMLPTIKNLNQLVKDNRKYQSFKANPPAFYDNNRYFNPYSIRQWAGAMIPRAPGSRNPIQMLETPVFPEVLEEQKHMRDEIRQGFQVDPLGEINSPVRSATEVSIRENRAQRTSSTDISRLMNEQPKQIYETSAKILAKRRLLTKDGRVGDIKTNQFRFDFQSPLFDLQKRDEISNLIQMFQIEQQFFGQGACVASANLGEIVEFLIDRLNLKSKLFKDSEELNKVVKQMGDIQQQQMQASMPTPQTYGAQVQLPSPSQVQI